MGLKDEQLVGDLPGLNITVIIASLNDGGRVPILYDSLNMSNKGCTSFSLNLL